MSFYFKANRGCEEHRGEKERGTEEERRRGEKEREKGDKERRGEGVTFEESAPK